MGTRWRQSKAPVGGLGQEKGLGAVQEGAGTCWLAWGRAGDRCSPQHGQQPCRQDPCQITGWGHVPKARAPGAPRRAGASGVPGCARGAHTAVGPAGKAAPQGAPWHWAGALHPPPSSALAAPALTQAQCQGQLGTAALSLNCCSSVSLAAPAPPPVQRRLHCSSSPSVLGGALGSGPAQQAQEPTSTVRMRTQGWDRQTSVATCLQAPSRSEGCPQQAGVWVPARCSTGRWHPVVPRAECAQLPYLSSSLAWMSQHRMLND